MSVLVVYFIGLPARIQTNALPWGITASETRSSICVGIFDNSKEIDYLRIFTQYHFGLLLARIIVLHQNTAENIALQ